MSSHHYGIELTGLSERNINVLYKTVLSELEFYKMLLDSAVDFTSGVSSQCKTCGLKGSLVESRCLGWP